MISGSISRVGPKTIEVCRESGIAVVAIEAGKTLLLDQPEMEVLANKFSITVTAVGA